MDNVISGVVELTGIVLKEDAYSLLTDSIESAVIQPLFLLGSWQKIQAPRSLRILTVLPTGRFSVMDELSAGANCALACSAVTTASERS